MNVDYKIDGLKEMEKALIALGGEVGAKTLRGALMDAAKPFTDALAQNAPESDLLPRLVKTKTGQKVEHRSGFLKSRIKRRSQTALQTRGKNIGKVRKRFRNDNNAVAVVSAGIFKVPYLGHVEFGTQYAAANPFFRRTVDDAHGEVIATFNSRIRRRIKNAERRIARNNAKGRAK